MAGDLKRCADHLDRWITSLEKAMNPTIGTVKHDLVRERRELKDKWKVYKTLFDATDLKDDDKDAAETEFTDRME